MSILICNLILFYFSILVVHILYSIIVKNLSTTLPKRDYVRQDTDRIRACMISAFIQIVFVNRSCQLLVEIHDGK